MTQPDLICSCWTHAGDAAPQRGDERSPIDVLERIRAVGAAGWAGIGLVHADLVAARDTIGYPAVADAIRAAGLRFVEVEFLGDWWESGELRAASDAVRNDLFHAADALGAQTIKVAGKMFASVPDLEPMREAFDELATQSAEHGARIALEPLPFSNFATVGAGSDFVSSVGNPNGGIIVDIWHVYRGGNQPKDLLSEVDPAYIFAVELNDAKEPAPPHSELWDDTVDKRLLPGQGDWDVPAFISVMRQLGFDGPWGVEILAADHRSRPLEAAVTQARDATLQQFERAASAS